MPRIGVSSRQPVGSTVRVPRRNDEEGRYLISGNTHHDGSPQAPVVQI
jgi:hypothetical protein